MRTNTWMRAGLTAVALSSCLAWTTSARAQTLTLAAAVPTRPNVSIRPDSLNPTWISRSDCEADAILEFSLSGMFPSGLSGAIQVWASSSTDCRPQTSRTTNTGTTECWQVSPSFTPVTTLTIDIHARDIVGQHTPAVGASAIWQSTATEADCSTAAGGIDSPQPVTLYFLYLPFTTSDATGTTPTYALKFDLLGPAAPSGMTTGIGENLLVLDWNQSTSADTSGYQFFCDPPPGGVATSPIGSLMGNAGSAGTGGSTTATSSVCPSTTGGTAGTAGTTDTSTAGTLDTTATGGTDSTGTQSFPAPPPPECVPGTFLAGCQVSCDGGVTTTTGNQLCNDQGTYDPTCLCPAGSAGGSGGVSGAGGESGAAGTDGTSGTAGASVGGTAGMAGASGTAGTGGTSGTSGTGGTSGSAGTSGTAGTSGSSATSGTSGSAGTTAVSNCGSSCTSNYLLANVDPNNAVSGPTIQMLSCGSVTGLSATHAVVDGLTNYQVTTIAVAGVDAVGNVGPLSNIACAEPQPIDDFYKLYREAGGDAGGGYCQQSGTLGAIRSASGLAPWIAVSAAGIARIVRRRRRKS